MAAGFEQLTNLFLTVALAMTIPLILKILFTRACDYSGYEQRIKELREMLEEQRQHYEQLLRDAAVKNEMMRGLWSAFTSGGLEKCYRDGGRPKVLADGAVVCDRPDKPYVIAWERLEEVET